ncbi:MAG: hypothetical protein NTZ05_23510 [Chloroflexi bacterium]|nr:hypothetical protein [Chloroflexota bacterium]
MEILDINSWEIKLVINPNEAVRLAAACREYDTTNEGADAEALNHFFSAAACAFELAAYAEELRSTYVVKDTELRLEAWREDWQRREGGQVQPDPQREAEKTDFVSRFGRLPHDEQDRILARIQAGRKTDAAIQDGEPGAGDEAAPVGERKASAHA